MQKSYIVLWFLKEYSTMNRIKLWNKLMKQKLNVKFVTINTQYFR